MNHSEIIAEFREKFVVHCSDGDILGKDGRNEVNRAKDFLLTSLDSAYAEGKTDMYDYLMAHASDMHDPSTVRRYIANAYRLAAREIIQGLIKD